MGILREFNYSIERNLGDASHCFFGGLPACNSQLEGNLKGGKREKMNQTAGGDVDKEEV